MKKIYNVTILGGTQGFGKWLAEYIETHFSDEVHLRITGSKDDNIAAVRQADVVIYSVPISCMQEVIEATLPHIPSGAVVADVTSIKGFPKAAMEQRDDIVVIPSHPMFGPYISSIAGQVFVLTPSERVQNSEAYLFLTKYLTSQKARVIESTAQYHDKMMAVVQGLTHLGMFVVGETMKRLDFNIADSMDFISPIYKLMVSSVGRYLGQNPQLYADIQMYNPEVLGVHEKFLETAKNFHYSVQQKDTKKFCQDIEDAKTFLGIENCQQGQKYTDKVIYMIGRQIDILNNNVGNKILLKNIYSGEQHSGVLEKYEKGNIFLSGGEMYKIDQYEVLEI